MMRTNNRKLSRTVWTVITISMVFFFGCRDKDKPRPQPLVCTSAKFAIINTTGAWPSQTSYLQSLKGLNISTLGNNDATEITSSASIWSFGGSVYSSSFGAPATLVKYTLNENCRPVESAKMMVVGANAFSSIEFVSNTKAYAAVGGGLSRLVIFNPSTMQLTGEVSLSSIQKTGSPNVYYVGSVLRDSLLFLAAYYSDANYAESFDSCFVAVINTDRNKLIKLISDGRTGMIMGNGPMASVFVKDAGGDIYVQGMGYTFKGIPVPSGILRIRNGETDFDPGYFLNLKTATGNDCYSLNEFNGTTFTWRVEDPKDFWCFNGPNFKLYRIDLSTGKSLGELSPSIPKSRASQSCPMQLLEPDKVYFSVAGASENSMWVYDLSSGNVSAQFSMIGQCNGIQKLQ